METWNDLRTIDGRPIWWVGSAASGYFEWTEDPHLLTLTCRRCGETIVFSAEVATPLVVTMACHEHLIEAGHDWWGELRL